MNKTDDPEQLRVLTAEALAESRNGAGVRYALINGLYRYPSGIGRDLDILVRPEDVPSIIAKCDEAVQRFGWDRLLLAESHLTRRLFASMLRRILALPLPAG